MKRTKLSFLVVLFLIFVLSGCEVETHKIHVVYDDGLEVVIECEPGVELVELIPSFEEINFQINYTTSDGANITDNFCEEVEGVELIHVSYVLFDYYLVEINDLTDSEVHTVPCADNLYLYEAYLIDSTENNDVEVKEFIGRDYYGITCSEVQDMDVVTIDYQRSVFDVLLIDLEGNLFKVYTAHPNNTLRTFSFSETFYGNLFYDSDLTQPVDFDREIDRNITLYSDMKAEVFIRVYDFHNNRIVVEAVDYGIDINEAFPEFDGKLRETPSFDGKIVTGSVYEDAMYFYEHEYTVENTKIGLLLASYETELEQQLLDTFTSQTTDLGLEFTYKISSNIPGTMIITDATDLIENENVGTLVVLIDNADMVEEIMAVAGNTEVIFVCAQHIAYEQEFLKAGSKFTVDASPKLDIERLKNQIVLDYQNNIIFDVSSNDMLNYVAIAGISRNGVYGNNAFSMWQSLAFEEVNPYPELVFVNGQTGELSGITTTPALLQYYNINGTGVVDVFITTTPDHTKYVVEELYETSRDYVVYGLVDETVDVDDLLSKGLDYAEEIDYLTVTEIVFQAILNVQNKEPLSYYNWYEMMEGSILRFNHYND